MEDESAKTVDNIDEKVYEDMTVAKLKELLKEKQLPVSGKKADLIERLKGDNK